MAQARDYWAGERDDRWRVNSHWKDGLDDQAWAEVGQLHLDITSFFAQAVGRPAELGDVVEWGCGGGANAVAFAPLATSFGAADVSPESIAETQRQVAAVCVTPVRPILVDIENPEQAVAGLEGSYDTFLCFYVIEATADAEEALRIVSVAERILRPGGLAVMQVKYRTHARSTKSFRRDYNRNLGNMTTFDIEEFWLAAERRGLQPRLITLVPRTLLDARYAYFGLTKPGPSSS